MKYFIVGLMMTILLLYAGLDHQIKTVHALEATQTILKSEISERTAAINTLENWRHEQAPPDKPPMGWPMYASEYHDLSSFYGPRNDPLRKNIGGSEIKYHPAVDMTGIKGAQVLSVAAGVVTDKWYDRGWHNGVWYNGDPVFNGRLIILHDNGTIAHYGHVADILVHEGMRVDAGQPIARISREVDKFSTGPHLDFRLEVAGEYVNPLLWIGLEE